MYFGCLELLTINKLVRTKAVLSFNEKTFLVLFRFISPPRTTILWIKLGIERYQKYEIRTPYGSFPLILSLAQSTRSLESLLETWHTTKFGIFQALSDKSLSESIESGNLGERLQFSRNKKPFLRTNWGLGRQVHNKRATTKTGSITKDNNCSLYSSHKINNSYEK